jgi:SPP1 family predicted phage head-tail adaptor|tara:strand:- start:135 stop:455 length:321 start_codon:yes stop_codon:yes gene_type:complete
MRHRIRLEKDTGTSRNAVGEITPAWTEKATAWAQIRQLAGRELIQAQQKKPNSTHVVTTHYQAGITPDYRIRWNPISGSTSTLHIEDVENVDYKNHTLIMLAKEMT